MDAGGRRGRVVEQDLPYGAVLSRTFTAGDELLSEAVLVDGREQGVVLTWYPSGIRESEAVYTEGEPDGLSRAWYPTGWLRYEGSWTRASGGARMEGPWVFWYPDGAVLGAGTYRDGREAGTWSYQTPDGEQIEVDYGAGLKIPLPPLQVGFDLDSLRDVEYDEPWGEEQPFALMWSLLDWIAFVELAETHPEVDRAVWADGLVTRDDLEAVAQIHPQVLGLIGPIDDRFRRASVPGPPLTPDREAWWWSRHSR